MATPVLCPYGCGLSIPASELEGEHRRRCPAVHEALKELRADMTRLHAQNQAMLALCEALRADMDVVLALLRTLLGSS